MDIREILNQLRMGVSERQISRDLGVSRPTIRRYRKWAQGEGLLEGELPSVEELQARLEQAMPESKPPQNVSSVEPYREMVQKLVAQGVEAAAIYQRLRERGFAGTYSGVYRFVRSIKPKQPKTTVRVERKPGEEGQIDFGYAGRMLDPESGKLRRAWAFVMTLSWSRHQFVKFVFDQKVETWLHCHRRAFEFFGGVPERVVPDNLKAAIIKACWDDPQVQYSYRECAQHYGFRIAPCRPRTPEHKGKVEQGGVHYVKRNFLGGREPGTITQANRDVLVWCNTTAGLRLHGTTKEKPLERFEQVEKSRLKSLPAAPYDLCVWKRAKVYRDCYVTFDHAFYSVPQRLYPGYVWICGNTLQVHIFSLKYKLEATHERATQPGQRLTNLAHLPPEKLPGLLLDRENCLTEAQEIGPATLQVVQTLLDDPVLDRLPTVGRLLRLRNRFEAQRLEAACHRALAYDDPAYKTIKRILTQGLEQQPEQDPLTLPPATTFARQNAELVGQLGELEPWN